MTARRRAIVSTLVAALVAYVPLLLSSPGRVGADTKSYLYLDPGRLLRDASSMWDSDVALGTVTHQNIGYLWPMGPFYWVFEFLGSPDWVAQRLWLGTLLFAAAMGVWFLLRTLGWSGPGLLVAMLAYELSPYLLHYSARISAVLLPWAGLPWLIALTIRAARSGGWRHPALFSLVVLTVGSVNATSLLLVGLAPVLWLAHVTFVERSLAVADMVRTALRIAVLTVGVSLWWMAGLTAQGAYSLPVTRYTETYEVVADASTAPEVLRGLGYWFFYGNDKFGQWIEPSVEYTQGLWLVFLSFGLVVLALGSAAVVRWRHQSYFLLLLVVGALIAIGAHPFDSPSPLGRLFRDFTRTDAGLALRSTPRAAPMLVLATAVLLGGAANAAHRRWPIRARPFVALVLVAVVLNNPAMWRTRMIESNLDRDDGASAFFESFANCPVGASIDCMIVQWEEFDFFPGDGAPGGSAGTFQAILYADSSILFQYDSATLDGASATVGISNDAAGNSLQYGCDSPGQTGAGLAIEFGLGDVGDLEITKTGAVAIEGPFDYTIDVINNGPEDQTGVVVTDMIPAELDFLSDDCGGNFADPDWTWNIGNLANGQSVSCTLTVQLVDINTCVAVSNTATVTGDLADPSGNSSSTISNGGDGNAVGDPGFEAGPGGGTWTEASTNFGTPVCDVGTCGTGTGTGPFEGLFWTWFGGIGASEIGSMTQDITINPGSNEMTFWLEQIVCDSAADFMEVTIDGTQVFFTDGSSPLCGVLGYSQQTVDISAFADGGTHTLEFRSEIFANNGGGSNFFVDLVEIPSAPFCEISMGGDPDNPLEIPTLDTIGLVILSLLLAAGATWRMRRRNEI